ncbi:MULTISPECIES: DUF3368 domain-containing protein [Cyanophyceae]|uniref:DUF3368 domain-containing protein n=1 Tax=Cyanophyceae TaxID=3028117 RepID=UPI001686ADA6|nr:MULTISPECIES: DUF3368 domain-containing protein [Cyanophyceae]MBD1916123.1 DUF3368 domain-containing protein [Phormidium sp. FACHB-77]MBD2031608.1 DUF3368 domain-containing protein [Phormidium sp. FACHB-322]MBD2052765.1 DUF3368 domain-containing protein [Leptolyngbya sp. FACHB-60]
MLIDRVVVNASPLIVLFKSGQADLLPNLFRKVLVPQAVWQEVTIPQDDVASRQLPGSAWALPTEVLISPEIAAWDLGAGESAVLSYGFQNPSYRAIVDDAAARRCARSLGIAVLGTGGIIVLAKRRGLIDSVDNRLKRLQDAGLWLSESVVAMLKQQAGE